MKWIAVILLCLLGALEFLIRVLAICFLSVMSLMLIWMFWDGCSPEMLLKPYCLSLAEVIVLNA